MFYSPGEFQDKKTQIIQVIRGLFDRFCIPTTEKIAGVYTVDLMKELQNRLAPVSDREIEEGLKYLITELTKIQEGNATK
jgi:hypothetical protein